MANDGSILTRRNGPPPMSGILGGTGLQAWGGKRFPRPLDLSAVRLVADVVDDSDAKWFEVEFALPGDLMGEPANGWTGPGGMVFLQHSTDLFSWSSAGWYTAPGHTPVVNSDGTITWRARHSTAVFWFDALIDIHLVSSRHGKEITGIEVGGTSVTLDYPYVMPAAAATLQADLRSAGFSGAVVATSAASLSATAINYTDNGSKTMRLTIADDEVTMVKNWGGEGWEEMSLDYPYLLPDDAASLQADIRVAGVSGAVVRVYGDQWEIHLPDYGSTGTQRLLQVTISPGDPYPTWNMFRDYLGDNPGNVLDSTFDNVRTGGTLRAESVHGFARLAS